jgi:hypothetical protein
VDLTRILTGPTASQLPGDLGVDVIIDLKRGLLANSGSRKPSQSFPQRWMKRALTLRETVCARL